MEEIFISIDIEADGPVPGEYSMLSFGAVAFDKDGEELDYFYKKLEKLPGAKEHPETMKWWKDFPEMWEEVNRDKESPEKAMNEFNDWLKQLAEKSGKKLTFVGMPIAFDFMFIKWYFAKFVEEHKIKNDFDFLIGINGIDVRTFAMALLGKNNYSCWKMSEEIEKFGTIIPKKENAHHALADARWQGKVFMQLMKENKRNNKNEN